MLVDGCVEDGTRKVWGWERGQNHGASSEGVKTPHRSDTPKPSQ
jgi:hypothetical protein